MADEAPAHSIDLLYPFYLDSDMSMAFAAALAGGVAIEAEQVDRTDETSEAVKNLRGNLKVFGALEAGGGRERTESSVAASESRMIRRHTDASIFINLFDELRRSGQVTEAPAVGDVRTSQIVSAHMGPAVAPLRRVVEQIIRLLDLTLPILAPEPEVSPRPSGKQRKGSPSGGSRQPEREGLQEMRELRRLFVALRDDLQHSGMIDIVVRRDDDSSVVLTLDERFVHEPCLELLHTSAFTIVGKVTNVWRGPDDIANLYRRSVVALLPALTQTITWGLLSLVSTIARGANPKEMERMAYLAAGLPIDETRLSGDQGPEGSDKPPVGRASASPPDEGSATDKIEEQTSEDDEAEEVMLSDELVAAINPLISGPAYQILPLAICS